MFFSHIAMCEVGLTYLYIKKVWRICSKRLFHICPKASLFTGEAYKRKSISDYIRLVGSAQGGGFNRHPLFQRNLMTPENRQFQEGCAAIVWVDRMHNTVVSWDRKGFDSPCTLNLLLVRSIDHFFNLFPHHLWRPCGFFIQDYDKNSNTLRSWRTW